MTSPSLTISVEPMEAGEVVYAPLAARKDGASTNAQLELLLNVTNNEPAAVTIDELALTFASPPAPGVTMTVGLTIQPGATGQWYFGSADTVLLDSPAPTQITAALICVGFSDPATATWPLTFHRNPVPGDAYWFPGKAGDLGLDEYWLGASGTHYYGGAQLFAYDLGAVRYDASIQGYSQFVAGGDPNAAADFVVWGQPVYAMADGVVVFVEDKWPDSLNPPTKIPGQPAGGNRVIIQHGDELVGYAHFQLGSVDPALAQGSTVAAGDFLGLVGNSGNSSAPHLHIDAIEGTMPGQGPLRPILFRDIQVLDISETPMGGPQSNWAAVTRHGLPSVFSAIYPRAKTKPPREWRAIDPLSLLLANKVYVDLTLPDPPPFDVLAERIQEVIRGMGPEARRRALAEVHKVQVYADAVAQELVKGGAAR